MNHKATFVYFFKADKQQEVIGSIMASDRKEALIKLSIIKQLSVDDIDRLFVIKQKKERS